MPFPADPSAGPGRLIAKAAWKDRLPHEGTLEVTFLPAASDVFVRSREGMEASLSLPGFRKGAAHLPHAFVAAEWAKTEERLVQGLAHEAVTLLKPHLGAKRGAPTSASEWGGELLSPLPEVVSHTDPLVTDTPLTLTLRLSLQPAPPTPCGGTPSGPQTRPWRPCARRPQG